MESYSEHLINRRAARRGYHSRDGDIRIVLKPGSHQGEISLICFLQQSVRKRVVWVYFDRSTAKAAKWLRITGPEEFNKSELQPLHGPHCAFLILAGSFVFPSGAQQELRVSKLVSAWRGRRGTPK